MRSNRRAWRPPQILFVCMRAPLDWPVGVTKSVRKAIVHIFTSDHNETSHEPSALTHSVARVAHHRIGETARIVLRNVLIQCGRPIREHAHSTPTTTAHSSPLLLLQMTVFHPKETTAHLLRKCRNANKGGIRSISPPPQPSTRTSTLTHGHDEETRTRTKTSSRNLSRIPCPLSESLRYPSSFA